MQTEPQPSLLQLLGSPEPRRFGEPSPPHHSPVLPPPRLLAHSTRKETRVLKGLMFRGPGGGLGEAIRLHSRFGPRCTSVSRATTEHRGEGEGKSPPATPHSLPRESGPDLLVHFEPSHRVLDGVLQPEEPGFSEPQRPAHQVKQVLPFPLHLRGQEGEAELRRRPLELFPFNQIHSFFFFFLTGKPKRHREVPLLLPPATLGRQEGHKADESHAPKPLLSSACTLQASTELRLTAVTPKPRGKRLRARSGHVLSAQLYPGATCTAPTPTRGRAPLLLSPTAALWAKQLRTSSFSHETSTKRAPRCLPVAVFPPRGYPRVPTAPG